MVLGFAALLALLFAVSYLVGQAAGPVAPGMHGVNRDSGNSRNAPEMPGMNGMEMR